MSNTTSNNSWLLPQGIEEALPAETARLESLRRNILDIYSSWGYQLVMPPMIEFLDSLLTGTGHDLDLQTFKLIDQLTGRLMGVRADMTPQVARIDSHQLKNDAPNRLCYVGTVLRTLPDGFGSSRSPFQAGVELYGHGGIESDVEVLCLMVETLRASGINEISIDIGHVGIYRGLTKQAGFNDEQEATLFEMMQRKAIPEIQAYLNAQSIDKKVADMLNALPELHGGESCLQDAEKQFSNADVSVKDALSYLQQAVTKFKQRVGDVAIHFDLSELRGYHYHTGLLFAAYTPGEGQEVARGGRYDDIGEVFGRARPATGFSTDLKTLLNLSQQKVALTSNAIFAPADDDPDLWSAIQELRAQGEKVIQSLPGQKGGAKELGCDQELKLASGRWIVD
ncbi:MAG: ATP phosphoribosyltransferase regulatory subunit [endosymbiont of Galathealinum brachiosum]|uniref:ATP phosphoribosyltransferase regulatory subunit n=1 Tax=endosymbiont of Galathealinum brachiosum TaxID=2200906 RepID=A0A370DL60_9GAMM|nr:MAG: ATP phosphoribosyltransferase regulatory subunit [endosymbiont of Galathealinum brachiosum]